MKICDMGCGSGANTWYLCNEGFDVSAFDGAESAIEQAKMVMARYNFTPELKIVDALHTGYADQKFDVLIDNVSMCYMSERNLREFYKEAYRIAKYGAKMLTVGFSINCDGVRSGECVEKDTYTHILNSNICTYDNIIHVWDSLKAVEEFFATTEWKVISQDVVRWTDYNKSITNEKYIIYLQK